MSYKIYMYSFPNDMVYIGMTKHTVQYRKNCGYQHNPKLKQAIKEYGWRVIEISILADNLSKDEAYEAEIYYIKKYNADNPEKGYNISHGGKSTYAGLKHTDEYKKRMSELMSGRIVSAKTIERHKAAIEKYTSPVLQYDENGNKIRRFASLGDAAKFVGGYKTNIKRACLSHKPYKGYMWQLESEVI